MKERIQEFLIAINKVVKFMWDREDYMKIRCINDFCTAFIDPDLF